MSFTVVLASVVLATLTAACGDSDGDCVDALQFEGRMYTDVTDVPGYSGPSELGDADLGEQAMVVTRENCGGVLENGEATTLDAGTPVYFVSSDVSLLAARSGTTYLLFIAVDEEP
jgi:hypothetical protein